MRLDGSRRMCFWSSSIGIPGCGTFDLGEDTVLVGYSA